jgi:hypothetical protein
MAVLLSQAVQDDPADAYGSATMVVGRELPVGNKQALKR